MGNNKSINQIQPLNEKNENNNENKEIKNEYKNENESKFLVATTLTTGNIIKNNNNQNEFQTKNDYIYLPNVVPGITGLHDRIVYFSVNTGDYNNNLNNQICYIEPATEHYEEVLSSSQSSFKSNPRLQRTYTPIVLEASSSNYDDIHFRRQGSHVG